MKKSKVWTFLFALIPGAGHMYLGVIKKGCVLMSLFAGIIWLSSGYYSFFDGLLIFIPVIWFYCFFDAMHLYPFEAERLRAMDQQFIQSLKMGKFLNLVRKRHLLLGAILICMGLWAVFSSVVDFFFSRLPYSEEQYYLFDFFMRTLPPTAFISAILVAVGVYLILGKKISQKSNELRADRQEDSSSGEV